MRGRGIINHNINTRVNKLETYYIVRVVTIIIIFLPLDLFRRLLFPARVEYRTSLIIIVYRTTSIYEYVYTIAAKPCVPRSSAFVTPPERLTGFSPNNNIIWNVIQRPPLLYISIYFFLNNIMNNVR